jgi:hypothetical protein
LVLSSFHALSSRGLTNTSYSQDFQFFDSRLAELQEREIAVHKRLNGIPAMPRDPQPDDTPEKLEEERLAAQKFIDEGTFQLFAY